MSEFKIEKDVELPRSRLGRHNQKYPFEDMEVGDSFFAPANGLERGVLGSRINNAARPFGKRHDMKFTVRIVEEKQGEGVRVWRVE